MSAEYIPPQVFIAKKGALSDTARRQLKEAGYLVIQANNPDAVKAFPAKVEDKSTRAKAAALDYAMSDKANWSSSKSDLQGFLIHFLKQQGVIT